MTSTPIASLSGNDRALFCSDIHLHAAEPQLAEWFLSDLRRQSASVTHLFLLGDIFEAWIGDDTTDAISLAALDLLAEIPRSGVSVWLMRGNRDFLIGENHRRRLPGFRWQEHLQLIEDPAIVQLWNEPVLLGHGDLFCSDDAEYQQFRALRNSAAWRDEFMAKPLVTRDAIARNMREHSEQAKLAKSSQSPYLVDANQQTVQAEMLRAGVKTLIHGHTHRPAHHQWSFGGQAMDRWVLPDWQLNPRRGGFLRIEREGSTTRFQMIGDWS